MPEQSPGYWDECSTCEHYRAEHNGPGGRCTCDVLQTPALGPVYWQQCPCFTYTAPLPD